jgi:hypothetical protein
MERKGHLKRNPNMSLKTAIQHNQSLFIAAILALLSFGTIIGCHFTQAQKEALKANTTKALKVVEEHAPTPWKEIAVVISTLISSGAVTDNRRKDVRIKSLKAENANLSQIASTILDTKLPNT